MRPQNSQYFCRDGFNGAIKEKAQEASGLAELCTWLFMKAGSTISFKQRGVSSFEAELTYLPDVSYHCKLQTDAQMPACMKTIKQVVHGLYYAKAVLPKHFCYP